MFAVICVGLGGFVGAVARYLLGLITVGEGFPVMTLLINIVGAIAIGVVFEVANGGTGLAPGIVLFLKTGVCGGFTTFSAFSLESVNLLEQGRYGAGALYIVASVVLCLVGVVCGRTLVRAFRSLLGGGI